MTDIIDYLKKNNIKWFPIYIEVINNKKVVNPNKHYEVLGYKMNMKDFLTIEDEELKRRQSLMYKSDYIAIDTNEVQQIDIDDKNISEDDLDIYKNISSYYLSSTKKLPHLFVHLENKEQFGNREKHVNNDKIEILNGQWAFCEKDTKVYNFENISELKSGFINKKTKMNEEKEKEYNDLRFYNNNKNDLYELVNSIHIKFIDSRDTWLRIGAAMFNLGFTLDDFDTISRKSENYGEIIETWNSFKSNPLKEIQIGTLCYYSKLSNQKKFYEIRNKLSTKNQLEELENLITTGYITHSKISKIFYERFKDKYAYSCGDWYRLNKGGLYEVLRTDATKILTKELKNYLQPYIINIINNIDNENHRKTLWDVNAKIENNTFKKSCIDETHSEFLQEDLKDNLDKNVKLIGFKNGVYDLENFEFRKGTIEDKVSFNVGYDYQESDEIKMEYLEKLINEMFETQQMGHWFKIHLGSLLEGINREEKVYFWVGDGRNGKGTIDTLLKKTLGDYYSNLDNTYYTTSKKESSSAQPELLKLMSKKIAMTMEPEGEFKYLTSKFKIISGNDTLEARALYSNNYISFEPTFKPIIQTNHLPKFTDVDDGLLNRLVVINFPYKFLDINNYDEKNPKHKRQDNTLKDNLKGSEIDMFHMMIKYFKIYKEKGILHYPKEVKRSINEYRKQIDVVSAFIEDVLIKTDNDDNKINIKYLYLLFNRYSISKYNMNQFSSHLKRHSIYTTRYKENNKKYTGIKGYILNEEWIEENGLDDNNILE